MLNKKYATIEKTKKHAFGKDIYLLGVRNGTHYWLEEPKWDCNWYWGFGYIETYTNDKYPERARDIESHQHFNQFFTGNNNGCTGFDAFVEFFDETPFTEDEIWQLIELMKSFYTCREMADLTYWGGSHYTTNAASNELHDKDMCDNINRIKIPAIFKALKSILYPEE